MVVQIKAFMRERNTLPRCLLLSFKRWGRWTAALGDEMSQVQLTEPGVLYKGNKATVVNFLETESVLDIRMQNKLKGDLLRVVLLIHKHLSFLSWFITYPRTHEFSEIKCVGLILRKIIINRAIVTMRFSLVLLISHLVIWKQFGAATFSILTPAQKVDFGP